MTVAPNSSISDQAKEPFDLTVVVPTFNGENRLPKVLEKLKQQRGIGSIRWEVLVVDNNSDDNTEQVVRDYQENWPKLYPLRYHFEPRQGLAFARQSAVERARGRLVGFLDDDNLPALDWVSAAYAFGQTHPDVGVYGSRIYGDFETQPPENFNEIAPFLALIDRGDQETFYSPEKRVLPPGAGLVVRRKVWLKHVPKTLVLNTKTDKNLIHRGEDLEAVLHIQKAGWQVWYNPKMTVYHQIPASRLTREYLMNLMLGIGLSRHRTRMLSIKPWLRPLAIWGYMLNDLKKIIFHLMQYQSTLKSDLISDCKMRLFTASLVSPLYIWIFVYWKALKARTMHLIRDNKFLKA